MEDFITYKQLIKYRNILLFERECANMKLGDINTCVAIEELTIFVFLKAAFVTISLSNKCISLIHLEHYKLT